MKISVVVGDHGEEYESPIEEASFYDCDAPRKDPYQGPPEIPNSVFAAAPDLLATCKEILDGLIELGNEETTWAEMLKVSIARAEGRKS